jgi:hypothetical protein
MIFNKRVLLLRDKKVYFINEINKDLERLNQLNSFIGKSDGNQATNYAMRPEEEPEKYAQII